ncbi:UNVERIFIED_CONTAM: hypothetical protein Sradi_5240700 [Sesamum radiatum]|uniref:DDE Tnp4 domain-containing protein n=1 Tax=Sesamum radiatum TaxID=300843 RepID=A0AAW2LM45_SESRA
MLSRIPEQVKHLHDIIDVTDVKCIDNLRMTRNAFGRLCQMLEFSGGLRATRHVKIMEQVAIFLSIIADHKKNCVVKHAFVRSGHTISKHINYIPRRIRAVQHLYKKDVRTLGGAGSRYISLFIFSDETYFHMPYISSSKPNNPYILHYDILYCIAVIQGCLGALDGTHVDIHVPEDDKARHRSRKGKKSINMLGVCNTDETFTYVLSGWEGSAADSWVLRHAITKPHGLKVPIGYYYQCDNGYSIPHTVSWSLLSFTRLGSRSGEPQKREELFNLRYSSAP